MNEDRMWECFEMGAQAYLDGQKMPGELTALERRCWLDGHYAAELEHTPKWINENPADSHESAGSHENEPVD